MRETVESILAQSFTDFELIIINDDSIDGSKATLRDLIFPRDKKNCGKTTSNARIFNFMGFKELRKKSYGFR